MASLNKVLLMGNLTRDPELRVTSGSLAICKFGLAVNRVYRNREGERKEDTTFVDVDAFGAPAETIAKYMSKGKPIFIEGRLQLDSWETNTGEKRSKLKVVCDNFQFIGPRGDGDATGSVSHEGSGDAYRGSSSHADADMDGDVPF